MHKGRARLHTAYTYLGLIKLLQYDQGIFGSIWHSDIAKDGGQPYDVNLWAVECHEDGHGIICSIKLDVRANMGQTPHIPTLTDARISVNDEFASLPGSLFHVTLPFGNCFVPSLVVSLPFPGQSDNTRVRTASDDQSHSSDIYHAWQAQAPKSTN